MGNDFLSQLKSSIGAPQPSLADRIFPKPSTQQAPPKPDLGVPEEELRMELEILSKTRSLEEIYSAIEDTPEIKDKEAAKAIARQIFDKTK